MRTLVARPAAKGDAHHALAVPQVIRNNSALAPFCIGKIAVVLTKVFLAVTGIQRGVSSRIRVVVARLTQTVVNSRPCPLLVGCTVHIGYIREQVELAQTHEFHTRGKQRLMSQKFYSSLIIRGIASPQSKKV